MPALDLDSRTREAAPVGPGWTCPRVAAVSHCRPGSRSGSRPDWAGLGHTVAGPLRLRLASWADLRRGGIRGRGPGVSIVIKVPGIRSPDRDDTAADDNEAAQSLYFAVKID